MNINPLVGMIAKDQTFDSLTSKTRSVLQLEGEEVRL